jgi:nitrate reductase NapA
MLKFTRRQVLKASAAAAAMAALGGCGTAKDPRSDVAPTPSPMAGVEVDRWFKTVCRYCGVGCGLEVGVKNGRAVSIRGHKDNPVNKGTLCVKAYFLTAAIYGDDRLKKPLIKENGTFREASWDEALGLMTAKFKEAVASSGVDSVAYYGSGQSSIDEGYLINKLFKGCIGTNNIEGQPRTCMASAVAGYISTYGRDAPMGHYGDIEHADVFFIIGSNMAEAHPIIYARVAERKQSNPKCKVIVADPRTTRTFELADYKLIFKPGYDLALLNAMAYVIVKEGLYDQDFISKHVNFKQTVDGNHQDRSFENYVQFLEDYTPEKAEKVCGIPAETIVEVARIFADKSLNTLSMWTMGVNQRIQGTFANNLIHNLHLLTGKLGKDGNSPFSLTGQPTAMGSVRETGALSHLLPGQRLVADEQARKDVAAVWGVDPNNIQPRPGLHTTAMFQAALEGKIKWMWVVCTNPGHSLPNLHMIRGALEKTFLVVSEAYHPTRTSELADIVLPAAFWCEKEGFYGNAERRTQHMAKAIEPVGPDVKPDSWAMLEFAKRLGFGDKFEHYKSVKDVFNEYRQLTIGRMELATYDEYVDVQGLLWPVVNGKESKKRYVYPDDPYVKAEEKYKFYGKPDGRAWIFLRPQGSPFEVPDAEYPYWFSTGRQLEHWHTRTSTRHAPELERIASNYVELHPDDAQRDGIKDGDEVIVTSRRGAVKLKARVGGRGTPQPGMLFSPMHDMELARLVNFLGHSAVDPVSFQMEAFKIMAAKISKA